ncbi:uncharacterized protein Asalp_33010 [Aeromonas salmonicida subsp. pectinolytica 34mel]|uniref:Uncharacterized protein n=2 Tax=Gammaproteobacteria TaxID=1236 RepID=A0A2D1QJ21_AERSA|nr:uncharacterized protein Asalp_33010 [Aeromonas salmonicida subsp. pectinolytica 34mel]
MAVGQQDSAKGRLLPKAWGKNGILAAHWCWLAQGWRESGFIC